MAYTKQNFKDGGVLKAEHLNAMDDQIALNAAHNHDDKYMTKESVSDVVDDAVEKYMSENPSGGNVQVVQDQGDSETKVMSQKAVTEMTISLDERIEAIENQLYTPISITYLGTTPTIAEIGSTVSALTLNWTTNKTPTKLSLTTSSSEEVVTISADVKQKDMSGLSATHDKNVSFTLKATDERDAVAEKSVSMQFHNGVYYGVAKEPTEYNSKFILGLSKELRNSKRRDITVTAGDGEYIYYCLPVRIGKCTFTVGGFTGGFSLVNTIEFENASGYKENYYIYKSDNANLGATSVVVG